ncbi:MAG: S-formylglutathione hydrolase [Bacteriovoracaceae bacterium]|jgi:S-formylglutathione hydrolase
MKFSAFLPKEETHFDTCIIWLSGLTCNEDNFITKAGAQQFLKDTKTMIVCPDTSPRGLDLPGEHESYDFGSGAGFYLSATTEGYKDHYKMDQYITDELVSILTENFGVKRFSIMGHSMGGHGALTLGLKNPDLFKSVSAFSPMVNPSATPWGRKALAGYLGSNEEEWKQYDATELIKKGTKRSDTMLIDQGLNDEFFEKELVTKNLEKAAEAASQALEVKYREGYDHSYFYISTFIKEHIDFHLKALT